MKISLVSVSGAADFATGARVIVRVDANEWYTGTVVKSGAKAIQVDFDDDTEATIEPADFKHIKHLLKAKKSKRALTDATAKPLYTIEKPTSKKDNVAGITDGKDLIAKVKKALKASKILPSKRSTTAIRGFNNISSGYTLTLNGGENITIDVYNGRNGPTTEMATQITNELANLNLKFTLKDGAYIRIDLKDNIRVDPSISKALNKQEVAAINGMYQKRFAYTGSREAIVAWEKSLKGIEKSAYAKAKALAFIKWVMVKMKKRGEPRPIPYMMLKTSSTFNALFDK